MMRASSGIMSSILSFITFLPLVAAAILALFLRGNDEAAQRNAKWLALAATTATFLISLVVLFGFDPQNTGFQFVEESEWILGLNYKMGVDGMAVVDEIKNAATVTRGPHDDVPADSIVIEKVEIA